MRIPTMLLLSGLALPAAAAGPADPRELVPMPQPMQEHMMANMRDHLLALQEMLGALYRGDVDAAGRIAENRIGMSSLDDHGAAHMAPLMPEPMQQVGTSMHRAASRFALAAQEADIAQTYRAQQEVFGALEEVTAACNGCHSRYKLR